MTASKQSRKIWTECPNKPDWVGLKQAAESELHLITLRSEQLKQAIACFDKAIEKQQH